MAEEALPRWRAHTGLWPLHYEPWAIIQAGHLVQSHHQPDHGVSIVRMQAVTTTLLNPRGSRQQKTGQVCSGLMPSWKTDTVVVNSKPSFRGCFKLAYDFSVLALTDILSYRIPLRWVVLGCVLVSPIRGFQLQAAFSFKPWQLKRSSDIPNASLGREALVFSLRATALVTFPVWGGGEKRKEDVYKESIFQVWTRSFQLWPPATLRMMERLV